MIGIWKDVEFHEEKNTKILVNWLIICIAVRRISFSIVMDVVFASGSQDTYFDLSNLMQEMKIINEDVYR